jgi:hypothetical protein
MEAIDLGTKLNIKTNRDVSLQNALTNNIKNTKIIVYGSCDYKTRKGSYIAILQYGNIYKKIQGECDDTTANRCILQGIIESLQIMKKPTSVDVITSTPVGIKKGLRGSGTNFDLIKIIFDKITEKKLIVTFYSCEGEGNSLKNLVKSRK